MAMLYIKDKIEKLARQILVEENALDSLPVDIIRIAGKNNIDIFYAKLPKDVISALKYDENKQKLIMLISYKETDENKRFYIAKEFAYYYLNKNTNDFKTPHYTTKYDMNSLNDIDELAQALLMDKFIIKELRKEGMSTRKIGREFKVSESLVRNRLINLGLD